MEHYTIDQIKFELEGRNLREMAKEIGLHENTLYRIQAGKTQKLAGGNYQILVEYLFGYKE